MENDPIQLSTITVRVCFGSDCIYTERKKKRRVNFIPKFHSSLKKFVKYFTMITKKKGTCMEQKFQICD